MEPSTPSSRDTIIVSVLMAAMVVVAVLLLVLR